MDGAGDFSSTFSAPCLVKHKSRGNWGWLGSGQFMITAFVYPTVPGRCRILFRTLFRFDWWMPQFFVKMRPLWLTHIANMNVLDDDNIFVYSQERNIQEAFDQGKNYEQACYMPTNADAWIFGWYKWCAAATRRHAPPRSPARSQARWRRRSLRADESPGAEGRACVPLCAGFAWRGQSRGRATCCRARGSSRRRHSRRRR